MRVFFKYLCCIGFTLFLANFNAKGQGCSDAGLCVAVMPLDSNMHLFDYSLEELLRPTKRIRINNTFGVGENMVLINDLELEMIYPIGHSVELFGKLPYRFVLGSLGQLSSLSDITIGSNFNIRSAYKNKLVGTIAFRLPSNNSDLKINGQDLPMPYQTSLGTYDLVLRLNYQSKRWLLAAGHQFILSDNNDNVFGDILGDYLTPNPYFISNSFRRTSNSMVRIERIFPYKKKHLLFAGVMPVMKLKDDYYTSNGVYGIEGSSGVAFNVIGAGVFELNKKMDLRMNVGMPLFTRKVRTDGLMRMFVGILGVEYHWN